ncbi:MAG: hypothetical protein ACWGOY_10325, partial [Anaerolineales bacterium]
AYFGLIDFEPTPDIISKRYMGFFVGRNLNSGCTQEYCIIIAQQLNQFIIILAKEVTWRDIYPIAHLM